MNKKGDELQLKQQEKQIGNLGLKDRQDDSATDVNVPVAKLAETEAPVATDKSAARPLLKAVEEQIWTPEPADAKTAEPGTTTAAPASLAAADGPAAATDADLHAPHTSLGAPKQERKRKAERDIPTVRVSKHKKRRSRKATPSSNDLADAAATPGNGDLPNPPAQEVNVMNASATSGKTVNPAAEGQVSDIMT